MGTINSIPYSKIQELRKGLNDRFKERRVEIDLLLTGILAPFGGNVLFIGTPGTAKSALARCMAKAIGGSIFRQKLIFRDMSPGDMFGFVNPRRLAGKNAFDESLERATRALDAIDKMLTIGTGKKDEASHKALKARRDEIVAAMLNLVAQINLTTSIDSSWADAMDVSDAVQDAHILVLDEVYKAQAVLNRLLDTLEGRRMSIAGRSWDMSQMHLIIGTSNELPSDRTVLDAFDDRWHLRRVVNEVTADEAFKAVLQGNVNAPLVGPTLNELQEARAEVLNVTIPDDVDGVLVECRTRLIEQGLTISTRKWKRFRDILPAYAYLNGRDVVSRKDVASLAPDSLWKDPAERSVIAQSVAKLADPMQARAQEIVDIAQGEYDEAAKIDPEKERKAFTDKVSEVLVQFGEQAAEIERLLQTSPGHEDLLAAQDRIDEFRKSLFEKMARSVRMRGASNPAKP